MNQVINIIHDTLLISYDVFVTKSKIQVTYNFVYFILIYSIVKNFFYEDILIIYEYMNFKNIIKGNFIK